jgi:hypothetical protein
MSLDAMLFTAHVNVTPFAEHIQSQSRESNESNHNFPHDTFLQKIKKWTLSQLPNIELAKLLELAMPHRMSTKALAERFAPQAAAIKAHRLAA